MKKYSPPRRIFPARALRAVLLLIALFLPACTVPGQPVDPPTPTAAPATATTSPTAARVAVASPTPVSIPTVTPPPASPTRPPATPTATARASATPTTRATPGTPGRATPGTPGRGTPAASRTPFAPTAQEPCVTSDLDLPPLPEKAATLATIEQAYRCLLLNHVSRKTMDHKVLLNGAWDIFKEAGLPAQDAAPLVLTGDREADWKVYATRFTALVKKYGAQVEGPLARVAMQGMASSLKDNHVAYLEPKLWRRFYSEISGDERQTGPGFLLAVDDASGKFYAYEVYPDTPASRAGMKAGDVIDQVNGARAAKGVANQGLYDLVYGEVGTRATVRVTRPATGQALTLQLTIAEYVVPNIESRVLEGREGRVGYIKLRQFTTNAGEEFDKALAGLQAQGIGALVLDVRQNPGGSTDALRRIVSHLTHKGPHAITIDADGKREEENPDTNVPLLTIPWVVLADGGSASSADITSAVAKDRGGYLIGTKTAGALGSAQIFELADGSALEITVNLVLGPNGEEINEIGVTPNQVVGMLPVDISAGNDPQLAAALAYLKTR